MTDLSNKIVDFLFREQRAFTAVELAEDFLKIVASPGVDGLVRAILSQDSRCQEVEPGLWRYRPASDPPWLPRLVMVMDPAPGLETVPWRWRVGAVAVGDEGPESPWIGDLHSAGVGELLERARLIPMASPRPRLVRRWLDTAERVLGIPEVSGDFLDLRHALRWVLREQGRPAPLPAQVRSISMWPQLLGLDLRLREGMEGDLEACAGLLLTCAEAASVRSFQTFLEEGGAGGTPVDFSAFRFSRADVGQVPEVPGIYRFLGEDDEPLYVGKAKNLRQRVLQYFSPLAEGSHRRRRFLEEVRDLEWVPLPSELSALILESSQIREVRPRWNVMIETHGGRDAQQEAEGDLLFAVPSALEPAQHEIYLLRGARAGRLREPLDTSAPPNRGMLAAVMKGFFLENGAASPACEILHPQEALLVHRWFSSQGDELLRLRVDHFSTWQAAERALLSALSEGAGEGVWVREPPGGIPGRP